MSRRAWFILVTLAFLGGGAQAQRRPPSAREQRVIAIEERMAALEKELAALRAEAARAAQAPPPAPAPPPSPAPQPDTEALQTRIDELTQALEELREDAASKNDLKRYVRKPDEKEYKSRISQELELRFAFIDLRQDEIANLVAALGPIGAAPNATVFTKGILASVGALAAQLKANDQRARPRMLFRLYWEANRFLSERSYLFVNAMPELTLFVYEQDIDRALIPRDVAAPRDRLGFIFKKAAAGFQLGRVGLQAGVLQFTYGSGFFINPTNVFTPKNPLDPRREVDGVPAVKMDLSLVQAESVTLTGQLAAVGRKARNDVLGLRRDKLALGALAMLRLDTKPLSVSAIGIAQAPDDLGRDHLFSAGGIISATPFGLTTSVEALVTGTQTDAGHEPQLVASTQGFTNKIGKNGMTYILEYVFDGTMPATRAEAAAELGRAVVAGESFLVLDRLTRPLGRRHYATLYLEPALTQRLRVNVAGLVGFDEDPGALLRAGLDYDLNNFTVHAFGGVLLGGEDSEFNHHLIQSFAELAVFASF